nr:ribbon-helix-helix protein, CopG family [Planctomycetota bacterium]
MGNRENKMRITIDVPESLNERLEEIQELTGASTKAAVVREALKLFDYLVDQEGSGYRVYLGLSDQFFPLPLLTDIGRA